MDITDSRVVEFRRWAERRFGIGSGPYPEGEDLLSVVMFAVELLTGASSLFNVDSAQKLFDLGAMVPVAVANGQYWRLVTVMFLHAGLIHLLFNMYALYLFGTVIERAFGTEATVNVPFCSRNSTAGFDTSSRSALNQSPKASPQPSRPRNKSYARRAMRWCSSSS